MSDPLRLALGDWEVDVRAHRLQRAGQTVALEPRAMAVLEVLSRHAGQVLSADQLMQACWPGEALGDNPVHKVITALRRRLAHQWQRGHPLVVLLGPSGCGKTSLVQDGVVPSLARTDGGQADAVPVLRGVTATADLGLAPEHGLFAALAGALLDWAWGDEPLLKGWSIDTLAEALAHHPADVMQALQLRRVDCGLSPADGAPLLILERLEVLLQWPDAAQAGAVVDLVSGWVQARHVIVLALCRNDFYARLATVLPDRRLLLRHGEPQRIGDRAFDLLLALLAWHGQTVGKDELLDHVWAGRDVEEGNLTVQMCELRRVLGREWLLTCAGRGYGFQGDVRFAAVVPSPHAAASDGPGAPASAAWMFGAHAVLPARRLLLRHGQPLPVGGRAFDLLCLLLEQRHRVVAPREILDRVWAGSEVGAGNIAAQLTHLRQRLGDACIRTVRQRGYQFTAEVRRARGPGLGGPLACGPQRLSSQMALDFTQPPKMSENSIVTLLAPR